MIKVSITLPNNAQITFESEESGVVEQVITAVLRDLPRDLMLSTHVGEGDSGSHMEWEKSTNVVAESFPESTAEEQFAGPGTTDDPAGEDSPPTATPPTSAPTDGSTTPPTRTRQTTSSPPEGAGQDSASEAEEAFIAFCRTVDPMGDMRMLVVAAEGARRFLSMDSVDTLDLERLFLLAGWGNLHSFIQTLRNAARSKFRWMARLSGRSGRYTVTDLGRAVILGESGVDPG